MCFERTGRNSFAATIGVLCRVVPFLLGSLAASAGSVSLAWNPSPSVDVAGYELYYGLTRGEYTHSFDAGARTTITVSGLSEGRTYYFVAMAYNFVGDESSFSNEVSNTVPVLPATPIAPAPPISPKHVLPPTQPGAMSSGTSATALTARIPVAKTTKTEAAAPPRLWLTGAYNGLFYQLDQNGAASPAVASTGFLRNCVIRSNGTYTARLACAGRFYSMSGTFNAAGDATAIIDRAPSGLSDLRLSLHLDSTAGIGRITGLVSNMDALDSWSAPITAWRATNSFAPTAKVLLLHPLFGDGPDRAPDNVRCVLTVAANGMVSLFARMEDGSPVAQSVAIAADGSFPVYLSLPSRTLLLTGWMNPQAAVPGATLFCMQHSQRSPAPPASRWAGDVLPLVAEPPP